MTTRTDLVFAACNRIAADAVASGQKSVKPTVRLVREYGVEGGNQTDIQNDIHLWFLTVFREHVEADTVPGVPDSVVQAFGSFWREALAAADTTLAGERQVLAAREAEALATVTAANAERDAALLERDAALRIKDVTAQQLEVSETSVAELRHQVSELKASVIAKDERLQSVIETGAARDLEHERLVASLRQDHAARVSEIENQMRLAQERFDGAEKHMLLEIDRARTDARELKEKLDQGNALGEAMRNRAIKAETELNNARGQLEALQPRLAAIEAKHSESVATIALLTRDLENEKTRSQEAIKDSAKISRELAVKSAAAEHQSATIDALSARIKELEG